MYKAEHHSVLPTHQLSSTLLRGDYHRPQRIALVAQGGGQRGIFTAGVLDAFLDADFNPFELYFGTSAGALNLSAYLCRQKLYGYRFITEFTSQPRFFNLIKYVRRQQFMDLDWALSTAMPGSSSALDIETGKQTVNGRSALACATDMKTLKPAYFPIFGENWQEVLKATCAIPMLYPKTIDIDGSSYVDGGVSAAIPAREAYFRGADIIIVIRTEPLAQVKEKEQRANKSLLESLKQKVDIKLPDYVSQLELDERMKKFDILQQELSSKISVLSEKYQSGKAEFLGKVRETLLEKGYANGGRWLFGGDNLYRLQYLSGKALSPDMLNMLTTHYQTYQESIQFLTNPPRRVEVVQVAPDTPLQSSALLSKPHQLESDYQQGQQVGRRFLDDLGETLNQFTSVSTAQTSYLERKNSD